MIAYMKKGKNLTPNEVGMKEDHFVGDYYTLFDDMLKENTKLEEEAHEMLRKWEKGDKKIKELSENFCTKCVQFFFFFF